MSGLRPCCCHRGDTTGRVFLSSLCSGGRGRGVWEGVEGCVAEESSLVLSQATTTPLVCNIFEQFFQNQIDGKAT